jgi:hypothetical protein
LQFVFDIEHLCRRVHDLMPDSPHAMQVAVYLYLCLCLSLSLCPSVYLSDLSTVLAVLDVQKRKRSFVGASHTVVN